MKDKHSDFASKSGVAIPIIQRDYVQGAEVNFEKRNTFMEEIFNALLTATPYPIDLIYGSSDEINDTKYFQPVDGQQRLTTLALIGWILNQKTGMVYEHAFKPITYTSRPSSEQFCKELFAYKLPPDYDTISHHITQVPGWFSDRWIADPTVMAMLEFLDKADAMLSVEPYLSSISEMAKRFFSDSPIEYELLDMNALHLNDDLYIKMNARGKLLTPFENWKAEFEGHLKSKFEDSEYDLGFIPDCNDKPSLLQYFEYAIEHEWCDLLWPIAYEKWNALSESDRRKALYPRIDEYFMNLLDFVSRFIFFASIQDVEKEREMKQLKEARMLYELEKDKTRMKLYEKKENVILLFQILDNLVTIRKNHCDFKSFFEKYFISSQDVCESVNISDFRVNLYDAPSVDLITLCFEDKLQAVTEVMLWAVLNWTIVYPECMESVGDKENMTDFLRIIMGWARGRRQRLTSGLNVNINLRLSNYSEAYSIILALTNKNNDLFSNLKLTTFDSLSSEREKGALYGTEKFKIIRILSKSPELYYSFNLLLPSLVSETDTDHYIARFNSFISMNDSNRIKALVSYGYRGILPLYNHYFYGLKGKWDFIFTIGAKDSGFRNISEAVTSFMNECEPKTFGPSKMEYYILKYPEFIQARYNHQYPGLPCHYFIHASNEEFTVWAVKTFSTQPIRGYNVNPYEFSVEKLYAGPHHLLDESDNSKPAVLYINENDMALQCIDRGWIVCLFDRRRKASKAFLNRYEEYQYEEGWLMYKDTFKEFSFDGNILLDLPGKDRIETALLFLESLE
ncbi:MAG: DUF262 domain-containing protein [Muribaculaceae bacterium]|nr:DUF262 domain-containing protein [Muribaculaceae bacterium]